MKKRIRDNKKYFCPHRSLTSGLSGNNGSSSAIAPGDKLISVYELGELSSMHPLSSTSTLKTSLKSHRANNLNIEDESAPCRANDVSLGECQAVGIQPVPSSSYSSSSILNQQLLTLPSKNNGNSNSEPLLCTSTLSSMASMQQHRVVNDLSITDNEVAHRCAKDISPGECQTACRIHSPPSFFRSPKIHLLSDSSSSNSDSGVSIL